MFRGAVSRWRRRRGASEADSCAEDCAVVGAPGVEGVAFEAVPGFQARELASEVAPLGGEGRVHRRANLISRPRHRPDAQVVDAAFRREGVGHVAADAECGGRRRARRGLRRFEDEISVDVVPACRPIRRGRDVHPGVHRDGAAVLQACAAVEIAAERGAADADPPGRRPLLSGDRGATGHTVCVAN